MFQRICFILSYLALAGVVIAPLLYFSDMLDKSAMKAAMSVATLVWFVCGGIVRVRSRVM